MKNTTEVGRFGETVAANYLKENKYKILTQNYFSSHNEIDIIAENKKYIVFVEVKTRTIIEKSTYEYETPASAVTYSKQKRILAAAQAYLNENHTRKIPRLDVLEIYLSKSFVDGKPEVVKINHIEDAFSN